MTSRLLPRLTPWIDGEDWNEVRQLLYSKTKEDVKEGCMRVRIWMDRGKVPTAVESTANFLEVILGDQEYVENFLKNRKGNEDLSTETEEEVRNNDEKVCHSTFLDKSLRLAYSAAVIRFVNELVDQAQKATFATSILKLADQLGLPRMFVDIRHDATHDQMASLEMLRWAAAEALEWLEDRYWSTEDDRNVGEEMKEQVHRSIDAFAEQMNKLSTSSSNNITPSLEKNVSSRILIGVDYLFTVERVMSIFLDALLCYPKETIVTECIIKLLARQNVPAFVGAFAKLWISTPRGSPVVCKWVPWACQELTELSAKPFLSSILQVFAANASAELFQDRLAPLWQQTTLFNTSFQSIYTAFEAAYTNQSTNRNSGTNFLSQSMKIIDSRRPRIPEDLQDWMEMPESWKPTPLGY